MSRTVKDLEAYLTASGRSFETREGGTIVIAPAGEGRPPIAVRAEGPVVFTVQVGAAPVGDPGREASLFRRLLELNASDLLYCAYGLREGSIVLSSAHEIENMDFNEVQAILSDIELALAQHMKELVALSGATAEGLFAWESLPVSPGSSRPT